jgi:hypothetical protein
MAASLTLLQLVGGLGEAVIRKSVLADYAIANPLYALISRSMRR